MIGSPGTVMNNQDLTIQTVWGIPTSKPALVSSPLLYETKVLT